jgi:hypothetical protein
MHDVDVMALVSYDQLSISGERDSAILYWTNGGGGSSGILLVALLVLLLSLRLRPHKL